MKSALSKGADSPNQELSAQIGKLLRETLDALGRVLAEVGVRQDCRRAQSRHVSSAARWYRARTTTGAELARGLDGCSRRVRGAPPLALANLTKEFAYSR